MKKAIADCQGIKKDIRAKNLPIPIPENAVHQKWQKNLSFLS